MEGVGAARLLPVVLAVVLGLLGMHALVIVEAGHTAGGHTASGRTATEHTAAGHTASGHTAAGHTAIEHPPSVHSMLVLVVPIDTAPVLPVPIDTALVDTALVDTAPVLGAMQAPVAHPGENPGSAAPGPGPAAGDPSPGMPGHGDHRDHVLHLCLAVLSGLIVLLAGLVLLGHGREPDALPRAWSGHGRRAPARPPPATSVRLARLCVLRT